MKFSDSFKTYDTTYQHFQGQQPALSYEPIRASQCNWFSKYHSILQNNKNKAWPITPTACGDHMSMEPTHATEKNPTHTCIHKYTPTHTHPCKPWKLRKLKANKAIKKNIKHSSESTPNHDIYKCFMEKEEGKLAFFRILQKSTGTMNWGLWLRGQQRGTNSNEFRMWLPKAPRCEQARGPSHPGASSVSFQSSGLIQPGSQLPPHTGGTCSRPSSSSFDCSLASCPS